MNNFLLTAKKEKFEGHCNTFPNINIDILKLKALAAFCCSIIPCILSEKRK